MGFSHFLEFAAMAKKTATSSSKKAPPTRRHRYGRRKAADGSPSVDPATRVPQSAPNFGRPFLPQIITFAGRQSTISNTYRNPDEAIRHSLENARFMRNDCSIMESLEGRQRAVALLNWHLEAEDKDDPKQDELVTDLTAILEEIEYFTEYRRNLLEAIWYGRTAIANRYEWRVVRGKKRICLKKWTPINGDKLAFRFDDGGGKFDPDQIGIRVGGSFSQGDKIAGDRVIELTENGMCYFLESWERSLMTVHKHMIEDGAFEDPISAGRIHGVGVRDRIYWCWFQKQETMAHLMEVIERTGSGFTIYYYQFGNDESYRKMKEVAEEQTANNVILMPRMAGDESMDAHGIERIEPSTAGIDALKAIIHEFFGHQIKRYILGQILSSESAATGLGSGVADLHADTFMQIVQYDAVNLEETITRELVEHLKNFNFPWARDIRVKFKIDTKDNESEKKLQAYKSAWDMGCKLKATDVLDIIGASMPDDDDEVLQNPAMQQQQRLWDQAHSQPGDVGPDGSMTGEDGQPAEEGSVEDQFGPLAELLGQGGAQDGGDNQGGADQGGGGPGGNPPPGGPMQGPQQYAKSQVKSSPGQRSMFDPETHRSNAAAKWKEELHPREADGKFGEKGAGHKSTATEAVGGKRAQQAGNSPGQKLLGLAGDAAEQVGMPVPGQEQKPKGEEQPFALSGKPVKGKTAFPGSGKTTQVDLFAGRGDAPGQTSFFDDVDPAAKNVGEQKAEPAPKGIGPGDTVTIPASNTFGQFEAEITDEGEGRVGIRQKGSKDVRPIAKMHRNQLPQFLDDLNGVIHGKPDSASESVNHVLAGKGKFLGRGNDGLAFDAGNGQVVKASSDIPFHWNNGLRDNHEGRNILQNQAKLNEHLRAAGVPGLLPQELHEHGGRTFITMPKVDTEAKLTPEHVQQLRNTLNKMHDAGYALKDLVQVGIDHEGNARIFDTGAVKKLDKNPIYAKDDMKTDEGNLNYLIKKHGHDEVSLNYERDYHDRAGHTEAYLSRLENNPDKPVNLEYLQNHRDSLAKAWEGIDDDTKEFVGEDHANTLKRLDAQIAKHSPDGKKSAKQAEPATAAAEPEPHLSRAAEVLKRIPKVTPRGLAVQLNGEVSEEHAAELLEKLRGGKGESETPAAKPPRSEYLYGLHNRPPGPGAVPKGSARTDKHEAFRHGQIAYDHPLSQKEIDDYELTPIRHDDDIPEVASNVAKEMGPYVGKYLEPEKRRLLDDFLGRSEMRKTLGHVDREKVIAELRKQHEAGTKPAAEKPAEDKPATLTPEDRASLPEHLKNVNPAFPSEVEKLKGIAEAGKAKSDRKFQTAGEAAKAGKSYAEWQSEAHDAFVNEEIDEDHPAWKAVQSGTAPSVQEFNDAKSLHGQHVEFYNYGNNKREHGKVTDVSDDGKTVIVTRANGTTYKASASELGHLGATVEHRNGKGKESPAALEYLAPKLAAEQHANGENIAETMRRHGLDPIKNSKAREAIAAERAKLVEAEKPQPKEPSEARAKAMEQQELSGAKPVDEAAALARKWKKNDDGTYTSPNGTIWRKAKDGGEVSPVTGAPFKGGALMPIHGMHQKPEVKPPKGDGQGGGAGKVKEEGKRTIQPMTAEQRQAEIERRELQAKWDKINSGPLKEFMNISDKPGKFASTISNKFRKFANELGPAKTKELYDHILQPMFSEHVEGELKNETPEGMPSDEARNELSKYYDRLKKDHADLLYPKNILAKNPHALEVEAAMRHMPLTPERLASISDAVEKLKRGESLSVKPAEVAAEPPATEQLPHSPAVHSAIEEAHQALHAAGLAEKPAEPEASPTSPLTLADLGKHQEAIRTGKANAAQIRDWFEHYHGDQSAARKELESKSVAELKAMGAGGWDANRMKKADLVKSMIDQIGEQYHVGRSGYHWNPTGESKLDALRRAIGSQTDEHVNKHVEQIAAARAERKERISGVVKAIENPETLEDFRTRDKYKSESAPPLTDEQQAKYDDLAAKDRREKEIAKKSTVSAFRPGSAATGQVGIVEGHHQKRNAPTYTVTLENHLGDNWDDALSRAKRMGGNYVNARIAKQYGATAGFQFFDKKSAEDFAKVLGGESADTSEQVEQRRIESIENASERLAALAENTHATADEALNADRKTNTHKRAEQAASAEASARSQKALAETMERLSEAMKEGKAPHLEGIRHRKHIEELNSQLRRARWARMEAEGARNLGYNDYEHFKDKPAEADDVKHADYPYPAIWSDQLQKHLADIKDEPGLMKIAQRLGKTAEDAPSFKGTVGKMKAGGGRILDPSKVESVRFANMPEGRGIRVHQSYDYKLAQAGKGNGPFYTADQGKTWATTPEIAVNGAVSRGNDLDLVDLPKPKLLKITDPSDIADLATAAKRLRRHSNRDLRRIGDDLTGRIESYNRMRAMDIKSPGELRAALRDYLPLRTKPKGEDKIKKLERELVGRKIEGFFPTPQPLVERMLDAADIQPGHNVLEPSAGKGDILDAIRERHPDAATAAIEPHSDLRSIIEAKGHALVDRDFTQHGESYDRIVMNPPFERGQDAEHVQHAFDRLKPGGRVVAIMSNGPFFRSDKKSEAFRQWLESVDGSHEELPEGSFAGQDAFRQTGVNTRLVVIDKPKE